MEQKNKSSPRVSALVKELADKLKTLPQPIHLLAVCTGGKPIAIAIKNHLAESGVRSDVYEVWTDTVNKQCTLRETTFSKEKYNGTAIIVEDVIWQGHHLPPIRKMLEDMQPEKKYYTAALLDCNNKCDYSVYN